MGYLAAVITCSDRAAADIYEDRSGPVLRDGLAALGFEVEPARIVPDDAAVIADYPSCGKPEIPQEIKDLLKLPQLP